MSIDDIPLSDQSFDFSPTDSDVFELSVPDLREQPGIIYPAVLLSNVLFVDCLRVLQSVKRSSYREFPLWVEVPDDGGFSNVGTIQLDSEILLLLRHLRISVTLYLGEDDVEVLDLNNPEVLEKFI